MRDDDLGTLRRVAWTELFPVLTLWRCLRLAFSARLMVLALVALALLSLGDWLFSFLLPREAPPGDRAAEMLFAQPPLEGNLWSSLAGLVPSTPRWDAPIAVASPAEHSTFSFYQTAMQTSRPVWELFRISALDLSTRQWLFLLALAAWTIAVWAMFGGAVTRSAAVRLARLENASWQSTFRFVLGRWVHYTGAVIGPLLAAVLFTLLIAMVGLVLLNWDVGRVIAGLIWPVVLSLGLLLALVYLGLLFGWPLMWASISVDGNDGFGAVGNAFSYVFQRPLHLLLYVIVATLFGGLGWYVASNLAATVVYATTWAGSLGSSSMTAIADPFSADSAGPTGQFGFALIGFWHTCVKMIAVAYMYSFFWVATTQIYFLLRRSVDGAELEEVYMDEEEEAYDLPPIPPQPDLATPTEPNREKGLDGTDVPESESPPGDQPAS